MRKLLLFFVVAFFSDALSAQEYIPFTSQRIINVFHNYGSSTSNFNSARRVEIEGDTTLGGLSYRKVYTGFSPVLTGAVRDDLAQRKVYYYSFNSSDEYLLYDFDIKTGDSLFKQNGFGFFRRLWSLEILDDTTDTTWVTRIDSVFMEYDESYHKRFHLARNIPFPGDPSQRVTVYSDSASYSSGGQNFEYTFPPLIEGYGYAGDETLMAFELFNYSLIKCETANRQVVKEFIAGSAPPPINSESCQSMLTEVSVVPIGHFKIFPNPSSGNVAFISPSFKDGGVVKIFNSKGDLLREMFASGQVLSFDVSPFPSGLYYLHYQGNNGTQGGVKLVRQ